MCILYGNSFDHLRRNLFRRYSVTRYQKDQAINEIIFPIKRRNGRKTNNNVYILFRSLRDHFSQGFSPRRIQCVVCCTRSCSTQFLRVILYVLYINVSVIGNTNGGKMFDFEPKLRQNIDKVIEFIRKINNKCCV